MDEIISQVTAFVEANRDALVLLGIMGAIVVVAHLIVSITESITGSIKKVGRGLWGMITAIWGKDRVLARVKLKPTREYREELRKERERRSTTTLETSHEPSEAGMTTGQGVR